jgi:FkbM family methyltransferase
MSLLEKIRSKIGLYLPRKRSFALNQLDLKLLAYLDFKNGFYLEAGANDGISQSNTYYFERYRNWRGILIEPIPELAEKCKINRPGSIVENCALVPFDFKEEFIEMRFCGLMSLVKGAMKSEEDELKHLEKGLAVQKNIKETYIVKVRARTLTSVLEQYGINDIDLFSLDVEGYELNVLKGLDFKRCRPNFILVEARFQDEIDTFLKPMYEPIAELSHHDKLYRSKAFSCGI